VICVNDTDLKNVMKNRSRSSWSFWEKYNCNENVSHGHLAISQRMCYREIHSHLSTQLNA